MNIGILAVDSNFPNLALMKISAYHKARGDQVEWYNPLCEYDKVYIAKVFTFTPDYNYYINANQIEKGGTGYDIEKVLPVEVDRLQPDYSIYNIDSNLSYGFLTRGCPNRCKWCVVPKKEGKISPYMDIEEITAGRKKAILMDNNILAKNAMVQTMFAKVWLLCGKRVWMYPSLVTLRTRPASSTQLPVLIRKNAYWLASRTSQWHPVVVLVVLCTRTTWLPVLLLTV